jgi:hypothetical protein
MDDLVTMLDTVLATLAREAGAQCGPAARAEGIVNALNLAWPAIVGRDLAKVSRPDGFDPGSGLVDVAVEPRWREALFTVRHEITSRVRRQFPRVAGVRLVTVDEGTVRTASGFSMDGRRASTAEPAAGDRVRESAPESDALADARTAGVRDPALRQALHALIRAVEHCDRAPR